MARTRALRIASDPLVASGPHRIGADWIARSDQEPQPLRSRPAARARPSDLGQAFDHRRGKRWWPVAPTNSLEHDYNGGMGGYHGKKRDLN